MFPCFPKLRSHLIPSTRRGSPDGASLDPGREPVHAAGTDGKMRPMTGKEKLLERVMALSETEADEALHRLNARRGDAEE